MIVEPYIEPLQTIEENFPDDYSRVFFYLMTILHVIILLSIIKFIFQRKYLIPVR